MSIFVRNKGLEPTWWWQNEALYTQPNLNVSYYVQQDRDDNCLKIGENSILTHMLLCCLGQLHVMNYRVCVI